MGSPRWTAPVGARQDTTAPRPDATAGAVRVEPGHWSLRGTCDVPNVG
jgi:hypothetical protein